MEKVLSLSGNILGVRNKNNSEGSKIKLYHLLVSSRNSTKRKRMDQKENGGVCCNVLSEGNEDARMNVNVGGEEREKKV